MNSALKNHATYINNKVDTNEISLGQYISTDNILQNKQGIECATSLPIQGGKVTAFKKGDILLANIRPYLKKFGMPNLMGVVLLMFWRFVLMQKQIVISYFMLCFVMIFLSMQ